MYQKQTKVPSLPRRGSSSDVNSYIDRPLWGEAQHRHILLRDKPLEGIRSISRGIAELRIQSMISVGGSVSREKKAEEDFDGPLR